MRQGIEKAADAPPKNFRALIEGFRSKEIVPGSQYIAFIGAHYDDESIGIGAHIPQMPWCSIIHVTDSAPADPALWKGGYASAEEYSDHRRGEMMSALDIAGHVGPRSGLQIPDQTAVFKMAEITERLAEEFRNRKIKIAITHAFEGGHPDHDAAAFAVHAAAAILRGEGTDITVVEAPFYRLKSPDDPDFGAGEPDVNQRFEPLPETEVEVLRLDSRQIALKRALYGAHASQARVMAEMSTDVETLRIAPSYDFSSAAHGGRLSHIYARNGIDSVRWSELATDALYRLRLASS